MAKSKDVKSSGSTSKSTPGSFRNTTKDSSKNKGTTSSVKPDDVERRDGPGGE